MQFTRQRLAFILAFGDQTPLGRLQGGIQLIQGVDLVPQAFEQLPIQRGTGFETLLQGSLGAAQFLRLPLGVVITFQSPDERGNLLLAGRSDDQFHDLARGGFGGTAVGDQPAFVQHKDAVCDGKQMLEVVTADDDGCPSRRQVPDLVVEDLLALETQDWDDVVKEQKPAGFVEGPHQHDDLPLFVGEIAHFFVGKVGREVELCQQVSSRLEHAIPVNDPQAGNFHDLATQ